MSDPGPDPATFLSGERGDVLRRRDRLLRRAGDRALDALARVLRTGSTLDRLATRAVPRDVLVLSVYRPATECLPSSLPPLASRRHSVRLRFGSTGGGSPRLAEQTVMVELSGGKFENLNRLLEGVEGYDWLLVVDDDVQLPERFLDRFVGLCEHFGFALAQPAQSLASHAAWRHLRRRPGLLARETRFVEIGPVTAFRRDVAERLLPFPPLRYGWGLDVAWSADAVAQGWRLGVADALSVRHEHAPVASGYDSREAIAEACRYLNGRPYLTSAEAVETVAAHRSARR